MLAGLQVLQGKVWVWGQGGASAEEDSRLVKPAHIAELADQWPPHGPDEQPWDVFGAQYMRDLPYGPPKHLHLHLLYLLGMPSSAACFACGSMCLCRKDSAKRAVALTQYGSIAGYEAAIEHIVFALCSVSVQHSHQGGVMRFAGWATLVENIMDPAHVNFSHHNVIGDR